MSTPRSSHDESADDDPTGVRALLSALPDPGPMPADLVARITGSLQQEQEQRVRRSSAASGIEEQETARPVPLVRRRNRLQIALGSLGAVAAAAVVGVVAVNLVHGGPSGSGSAAEMHSASSSAAAGAVPQSKGSTPAIRDLSSGRAYSTASFAKQAAALSTPAKTSSGSPATARTFDRTISRFAMRSCVSAVEAKTGQLAPQSVVVDRATYNGTPALIMVLRRGKSALAYAVGTRCSSHSVHVLHGPVAVH